jgi:hypothetical protein
MNEAVAKTCVSCGTGLVKKPFRMTKQKIAFVHALAHQKGLDDEMYRLRLKAVGVESCKEMKRKQFDVFVKMMKKLPDAPRRLAA